MGLSLREAAKREGITHQALMKAARAGSISLEPDGTVKMAKLRNSEWYRNRNKGSDAPEKQQAPEKIGAASPLSKLSGVAKIDLEKLLILERKESLRLDNEVRRGKLVEKQSVIDTWTRISSQVRNRLLLLSGSIAAKLAVMTDPREVEAALDVEVRDILTALSEMALDEA